MATVVTDSDARSRPAIVWMILMRLRRRLIDAGSRSHGYCTASECVRAPTWELLRRSITIATAR